MIILSPCYAYIIIRLHDAFGNEVNPSAGDTNPFRYAGQYFDSETGTYYLRARYYSPAIGRFTQQDDWAFADPSQPLSLNLYAYCWNNPIRYHDPSGHIIGEILLALGLLSTMFLLNGCGTGTQRRQSSAEEVEQYVQEGYMLFPYRSYADMETAAIDAADYLFNDEYLSEEITRVEYQINIVMREDTGDYYVTKPYTDKQRDRVYYKESATPDGYVTVATLHTHDHIKDDPDSVFSKDKNNLREYTKYVLETEGKNGRLVKYIQITDSVKIIRLYEKKN